MNKKQIISIVLIAFFVGAVGSIFFGRFLIPFLATIKGLERLNDLASTSPIVINRTQEVQLNEGVNLINLSKQAANFTVTVYSPEANPSFLGNGIIVTSDGLIFISKTIIQRYSELVVVLNNGAAYKALVRAVDPKSDIAAITIEEKNLNTASFADSMPLEAGQRVLILGESYTPFTRSLAQGFVTNGVLNASLVAWRVFSSEVLENSFEIDADVNTGRFIGSPIVGLQGKVIGMVTGSTIQKIVISENLQSALDSYLSNGKIVRPKLGLSYFNLSKTSAAMRALDRAGILVVKADDPGPAAQILLPNDLIFEVDGQNLENKSFEQIIQRHAVGDVKFKLLRNGKEMEVTVKLEATK